MLSDLVIQSIAKKFGVQNLNIRYGDITIDSTTQTAEKNIGDSIAIITGVNIIYKHTIPLSFSYKGFQAIISSEIESNSVNHFRFHATDVEFSQIGQITIGNIILLAEANCIIPAKGIIKLSVVIPSVLTFDIATVQYITIN